jgi:hypothetical protein
MGCGSGSKSIHSVSYPQDVEFYPLFHIWKEGLAIKLSQLLNCSLEVAVIPYEDQLLLLFQYDWFSIGAKMNLCDSGRLKVVGVAVGETEGVVSELI